MSDEYPQPTDQTLTEFNYDSHPAKGILRLDQPDDTLWWEHVYEEAAGGEWWYDYPDEPTFGDAGNKDGADGESDEAKIRDWCRRNVKPPAWAWHRFVELPEDEQDDENMYTLHSSATPRDGYWRGAIIELTAPTPEEARP